MAGTINLIAGETGYPFVLSAPAGVDLTQVFATGAIFVVTDPTGAQAVYPMTIGASPLVINNVGYAANAYVWIPEVASDQFAIPGRWSSQLFLYMLDGTLRKGKLWRFDVNGTLVPPSTYLPPVTNDDEEDVLTSNVSNITVVAAQAGTVAILPANALRKSVSIFNDSPQPMFLAAAGTASASAYTTQIPPGEFFESSVNYLGPYSAVWVAATGAPTGNARITEYS